MPDIIDSRDLLSELRDLLDDPSYNYTDDPAQEAANNVLQVGDEADEAPGYVAAWLQLDDDDRERVTELRRVLLELPVETVETVDGRNSWGYTMVPEDDFADYAEQYAEDVGAIDTGASADQWPLYCIDWKQAARELAQDFTSVEFDGVTYLCRD